MGYYTWEMSVSRKTVGCRVARGQRVWGREKFCKTLYNSRFPGRVVHPCSSHDYSYRQHHDLHVLAGTKLQNTKRDLEDGIIQMFTHVQFQFWPEHSSTGGAGPFQHVRRTGRLLIQCSQDPSALRQPQSFASMSLMANLSTLSVFAQGAPNSIVIVK